MSRRTERLGSQFRQEISRAIARELADPRIKATPVITRVKVSEDLSVADAYFTVMGTPGEQSATLHALTSAAGKLRRTVGDGLTLRQMPALRFHVDEQAKKEVEVLELLAKLEAERAANPPPRDAAPDPA